MENRPGGNIDRASAVLILIVIVALLIAGVVLLWVGLDGWIAGQIWVSPKASRPHIATPNGVNSRAFYIEVFAKCSLGLLLTSATGWFLAAYLLSSRAKRLGMLKSFRAVYGKDKE